MLIGSQEGRNGSRGGPGHRCGRRPPVSTGSAPRLRRTDRASALRPLPGRPAPCGYAGFGDEPAEPFTVLGTFLCGHGAPGRCRAHRADRPRPSLPHPAGLAADAGRPGQHRGCPAGERPPAQQGALRHHRHHFHSRSLTVLAVSGAIRTDAGQDDEAHFLASSKVSPRSSGSPPRRRWSPPGSRTRPGHTAPAGPAPWWWRRRNR